MIGTDPDVAKCELARRMGAEIARPSLAGSEMESLTAGIGADAVLITASTPSNGPIDLAAAAVRKRAASSLLASSASNSTGGLSIQGGRVRRLLLLRPRPL